jgi:uncharacterized protein with PIN domain
VRIAVDTNVLVRYLTWDDEAQAIEAANAIEGADAMVVPTIVLCELVWVLKRAYRYAGPEIIDILRRLVAIRAVEASRRRGRNRDACARRRLCRRRRSARGRPCEMRSRRHIRPGLRATSRSRPGHAFGNSARSLTKSLPNVDFRPRRRRSHRPARPLCPHRRPAGSVDPTRGGGRRNGQTRLRSTPG